MAWLKSLAAPAITVRSDIESIVDVTLLETFVICFVMNTDKFSLSS